MSVQWLDSEEAEEQLFLIMALKNYFLKLLK